MAAALLKIKHSVIPCVSSFSLLVMQDLHQDTLSIRLGSHSRQCRLSLQNLTKYHFSMGQGERWGSVYQIFGVLCPLLQGEGQKLPSNRTVSKVFIQSTSVIHVPQQGTLKCPINPVTARQCHDVTDKMMAFAYFCVGQTLEPLQISGDNVPLTIRWWYKIKQMIILWKCSKVGMNFSIIFYTCCGQYIAPMRCFCQILLLVLIEGKELRSIYFGYRKRIWRSLVLLLLCI